MDFTAALFDSSGSLRSCWRFAIFLTLYFILTFVLGGASVAVLSFLPIGYSPGSLLALTIPFAVFSAVAIILGWLFAKIFESLPFRSLGIWFTKYWLRHFATGTILGALCFCLAAMPSLFSGGLKLEFNDDAALSTISLTLTATLLVFAVVAISEETLFRGYLLQTMSRAKLFWLGIILTSFLFATAHNYNPGATLLSWLNTFLAGIWFAVGWWKTRDLWLPLGMHLAWNWFQGSIFGINVSGLQEIATAPLFRPLDIGPAWLTGGTYGIEGSIGCTLAMLVSTAAIYFLPFLKPSEEMQALNSPPG